MNILLVLQIIISVSIIALVLMQSRGSGLGSAFGSSGKSYHSRRGVEDVMFKATIVFSAMFILVSLVTLFV